MYSVQVQVLDSSFMTNAQCSRATAQRRAEDLQRRVVQYCINSIHRTILPKAFQDACTIFYKTDLTGCLCFSCEPFACLARLAQDTSNFTQTDHLGVIASATQKSLSLFISRCSPQIQLQVQVLVLPFHIAVLIWDHHDCTCMGDFFGAFRDPPNHQS